MKKIISILTSLLMLTFISNGQNLTSKRTASLMTGDYNTEGTVHLESFDDGSLKLRFEDDYLTQSNVFDVHVFLSKSNNYNAPIDTTGMLLVENIGTISGINYSSGAMTFNLPSGVKISDYQYIVFVCIQYGRLHWADGTFGAEKTVTGLPKKETIPLVNVYPNPSSNGTFTVTTRDARSKITVMDLRGRIINEIKNQNTIKTFSVPQAGSYFIHVNSEKERFTQKLISY